MRDTTRVHEERAVCRAADSSELEPARRVGSPEISEENCQHEWGSNRNVFSSARLEPEAGRIFADAAIRPKQRLAEAIHGCIEIDLLDSQMGITWVHRDESAFEETALHGRGEE